MSNQPRLESFFVTKKRTREDDGEEQGSAAKRPKTVDVSELGLSEFGCQLVRGLKDPHWVAALASHFRSASFRALMRFVGAEFQTQTIFPPAHEVFAAFNYSRLSEVKVVILGQDPYIKPNQAHGLCFSVKPGNRVPPSLRNMYKELSADVKGFVAPPHGYLKKWAMQGVLMLNAVMTVREGKSNSHKNQGWEKLTDAAIKIVSDQCKNVVFILWGSYAQKKATLIDKKRHLVLRGVHPSPLSASRGFFGGKYFTRANAYLDDHNRAVIDWSLPNDPHVETAVVEETKTKGVDEKRTAATVAAKTNEETVAAVTVDERSIAELEALLPVVPTPKTAQAQARVKAKASPPPARSLPANFSDPAPSSSPVDVATFPLGPFGTALLQQNRIDPAWLRALEPELRHASFRQLMTFLETEVQQQTIYPPLPEIFSAFNYTPLASVKVVILGQDPYIGPDQAHGLCFSVKPGNRIPPSLRNMYKELQEDVPAFTSPSHGYLEAWARQGVLMINAVMTVRHKKANSHKNQGWEKISDAAIRAVSAQCKNVVFLLWGSYAQKKAKLIDATRHLVIKGVHPSPLSARKGFFGGKFFSQTNAYLEKHERAPINWTLPATV